MLLLLESAIYTVAKARLSRLGEPSNKEKDNSELKTRIEDKGKKTLQASLIIYSVSEIITQKQSVENPNHLHSDWSRHRKKKTKIFEGGEVSNHCSTLLTIMADIQLSLLIMCHTQCHSNIVHD